MTNKIPMRTQTVLIGIALAVMILLVLAPMIVFAWDKPMREKPPSDVQQQRQGQQQGQQQRATAKAVAGSESFSEGSSATSDNSIDISNVQPRQVPDLVLVPHNNTASCTRVFGFGGANPNAAIQFGYAYESRSCVYEQDADDAMAAGQFEIAYFWDCHKKTSYKPFRRKGGSKEQAIEACYQRMMQLHVVVPRETPAPTQIQVDVTDDCNHDETHNRIFEKCQAK